MTVELISKEALVQLRRQARLEKRKARERALDTTLRDLIEKWHADYSAFCARLAQGATPPESEPEDTLVPDLPNDEVVGQYEDKADIRLLLFARDAGVPVLVNFGGKPSKLFENNLRHSAKIRGCALHFYRLIGGYIALEIESRDERFLKQLGIQAV